MVKLSLKICSLFFLLDFVFIVSGCNNDLFGLFGSTDLDIRLKEKNNLKFLASKGWDTPQPWGDQYSFIVLTDTHIENGNANGLEKLQKVITAKNIQFVVITGDITQHGTERDIQKFMEIASSLGVPCYPVIGNHDIYFGNWPSWKNHIGSTRYRIVNGNTTLLVLDSANAFFGRSQLDWLQKELKNAGDNVFVFTHANLFVESLLDSQQITDLKERALLISTLQNRADAMFMGHVHRRIIKDIGNVRYVTIEDFRDNQVYCRVSVTKTGITYTFEEL